MAVGAKAWPCHTATAAVPCGSLLGSNRAAAQPRLLTLPLPPCDPGAAVWLRLEGGGSAAQHLPNHPQAGLQVGPACLLAPAPCGLNHVRCMCQGSMPATASVSTCQPPWCPLPCRRLGVPRWPRREIARHKKAKQSVKPDGKGDGSKGEGAAGGASQQQQQQQQQGGGGGPGSGPGSAALKGLSSGSGGSGQQQQQQQQQGAAQLAPLLPGGPPGSQLVRPASSSLLTGLTGLEQLLPIQPQLGPPAPGGGLPPELAAALASTLTQQAMQQGGGPLGGLPPQLVGPVMQLLQQNQAMGGLVAPPQPPLAWQAPAPQAAPGLPPGLAGLPPLLPIPRGGLPQAGAAHRQRSPPPAPSLSNLGLPMRADSKLHSAGPVGSLDILAHADLEMSGGCANRPAATGQAQHLLARCPQLHACTPHALCCLQCTTSSPMCHQADPPRSPCTAPHSRQRAQPGQRLSPPRSQQPGRTLSTGPVRIRLWSQPAGRRRTRCHRHRRRWRRHGATEWAGAQLWSSQQASGKALTAGEAGGGSHHCLPRLFDPARPCPQTHPPSAGLPAQLPHAASHSFCTSTAAPRAASFSILSTYHMSHGGRGPPQPATRHTCSSAVQPSPPNLSRANLLHRVPLRPQLLLP